MEIQIFGETITIKYSLRVQQAYEEMIDKQFEPADLDKTKNRVALCYAAIIAYNKNTAITVDSIYEADIDTITTLETAVLRAYCEWRKIPAPTNDPALTEEHTDEEQKA